MIESHSVGYRTTSIDGCFTTLTLFYFVQQENRTTFYRMHRSALTGDTGALPLHLNGLHKCNDDYISQLVHRLEELDISRGKPNHLAQVHNCNGSLEREDYRCSSNLESPLVLEELSGTRPRMLTQRLRDHLKPQLITGGNLHQQTQGQRQQNAVESADLLRITPMQVSNSQWVKTRWWVKREWTSISDLWGADINESSRELMGYHSNDSDISDQEKGNAFSHWASPIEMDLRPEPFDRDPDILTREAAEAQQVYPEVLPGPLKWLHMTRSLSALPGEGEEERAWHGLYTQDASVSAIVSRLIELERLQAATVLKERVRTGRSRPATAVPITRCCLRQRKPDPCDPRLAVSGRGECRFAVSVFTDMATSDKASMTHKMTTSIVQTKQRQSKMGSKHKAGPSNRPSSCSELRAEKLVPGLSSGSSTSPKPTLLNKTKRLKATKKEISKRGRTGFTKGHKSKV
ncbi:uncharacterized protein LOC125297721 isoform X1 [Alosa alosa]|nr:uncharacterized protein LOC125297721 isoform X1 [Alosa alosa]